MRTMDHPHLDIQQTVQRWHRICFRHVGSAAVMLDLLPPCWICCRHVGSAAAMLDLLPPCWICCRHVGSAATMLDLLPPCWICWMECARHHGYSQARLPQ